MYIEEAENDEADSDDEHVDKNDNLLDIEASEVEEVDGDEAEQEDAAVVPDSKEEGEDIDDNNNDDPLERKRKL